VYQLTKVRLVATATYLPEDYLRLRLRFAKPRVSVGRVKRPVFAALWLEDSAQQENRRAATACEARDAVIAQSVL